MWTKEITDMIINGVWATLYMTVASTVLGYVFGLPMGVLLAITDKEGLTPNAVVYKILDEPSYSSSAREHVPQGRCSPTLRASREPP